MRLHSLSSPGGLSCLGAFKKPLHCRYQGQRCAHADGHHEPHSCHESCCDPHELCHVCLQRQPLSSGLMIAWGHISKHILKNIQTRTTSRTISWWTEPPEVAAQLFMHFCRGSPCRVISPTYPGAWQSNCPEYQLCDDIG